MNDHLEAICDEASYNALKDTALGRTVTALYHQGFHPARIKRIIRSKGGSPELCAHVEGYAQYLKRKEAQ